MQPVLPLSYLHCLISEHENQDLSCDSTSSNLHLYNIHLVNLICIDVVFFYADNHQKKSKSTQETDAMLDHEIFIISYNHKILRQSESKKFTSFIACKSHFRLTKRLSRAK